MTCLSKETLSYIVYCLTPSSPILPRNHLLPREKSCKRFRRKKGLYYHRLARRIWLTEKITSLIRSLPGIRSQRLLFTRSMVMRVRRCVYIHSRYGWELHIRMVEGWWRMSGCIEFKCVSFEYINYSFYMPWKPRIALIHARLPSMLSTIPRRSQFIAYTYASR